jgi:extracellular elastinolytic metalloproteinase
MYRLWIAALFIIFPLYSQHVFHPRQRLTGPSRLTPREISRDFLRTQAPQQQIAASDIDAAYIDREYRTAHNGVTHLLYRQQFQGLDVDNAEWVVNIDSEGQVINAGGTLSRGPRDSVPAPDSIPAMSSIRAAARAVNAETAARFSPIENGPRPRGKGVRFAGSSFPGDIDAIPVWWSVKGELRPAWKFGIFDTDGITRWSIVVDGETRKVLSKVNLTMRQSGPRGMVYDQGSPQPNPKPGTAGPVPPPVVQRTLQSFAGDPAASPKGWVTGNETAGNNVVAGTNVTGSLCPSSLNCLNRPQTTVAADGNFTFPIDLAANPTLSPDASTVNLFYWANKAHDWFYLLGFDEAAGNFQVDNFNRGGQGGDPMYAYSLFGSGFSSRPELNNAFYTALGDHSDGTQALIAFFLETANGLYYDNALDGPTIVHEYTHGISDRLVRNHRAGHQGRSMSEGWSDFFAIEFLTPEGAPADGIYPFSEYSDQVFNLGIRTRPYSTRMDINPLTFAHLGHVIFEPEVHADGEIWFEALWEIRANLIQQFGEKEGRRRTRLLVIDGMKLTSPAPSMIDARDAILLADQVDFKGASQQQIWAGFAKRGLGVLAMATNAASIHIRASYETPSSKGSLAFYEDKYVLGERVRIILQDANVTADTVVIQVRSNSGDLENVTLRRRGQVFTGFIDTNNAPVALRNGTLELIAGDFITAFYNDGNSPGGAFQATASAPVLLDYDFARAVNTGLRFSGERPMGLAFSGARPFALPWPFPFFNNRYSQLWVHETGLLSFDSPSFAPCADADGLYVTNGIAPMFMDLTTGGGAQSAEDVYTSATDDSVTFRWAAETLPDFLGTRPEAVNFAATLFKDGRIQFSYGAGNRNLTGGSNFFGCLASTPVVGISNGHESFLQLAATHDGKGTLENATTVIFDPPFNPSSAPVIRLESPADGDKVQSVLSGKGVIYDPNPDSSIRGIDVLIDGIAIDTAVLGIPRPDFCGSQRVPGCPNVGFTFLTALTRATIGAGKHTLQLRASNRRGYFVDAPQTPLTFTVDPGEAHLPVGVIEAPAAGQELVGTVAMRGYAYSDLYRVTSVDVLVDGITAGRAAYTTTRSDICGSLSPAPPNCPRVGWTFSLNTRTLSNGPHTIAVRVSDETGRIALQISPVAVTVKNTISAAPVVVIASPKPGDQVSGSIKVSGYAYAPAGRIARGILSVDGYPVGNLTYGSARPDVCASLSGIAACPNIGFEVDFDTQRLTNGPHFLSITVQDDKGSITTAPASFFGGLDFVVKN